MGSGRLPGRAERPRLLRLLVVDNNPQKLQRWCNAAERVGKFNIVAASTFEEAQTELYQAPVELMVTDLFLTAESEDDEENHEGAEGLRLITLCRSENPNSKIIAITKYTGDGVDIGVLALGRGADDFISDSWIAIQSDALLEHKLDIYAELMKSYPSGVRS
jgi:ActR/RegA family two-component response regulator